MPGVWKYYAYVVLAEATFTTLIPSLSAMIELADDSLFIFFRNIHGVLPFSASIVIAEASDATIIPQLGPVVSCVDKLFPLPPPP